MLSNLVDISMDIAIISIMLAAPLFVIFIVVLIIQIIQDLFSQSNSDNEKGDGNVEKKIINLTKETEGGTCLLCCEREATVKVAINRVKYDDNVVGFHVCDKCLSQMQEDMHKICE